MAVIGQQLLNLRVHEFEVVIVALARILFKVFIGVDYAVELGKVRVVPVQQREVQPDLQPLGAECLHKLAYQIAPARRIGGLKVGLRAVEQAESVVVLGSQYGVLHARGLGDAPPRSVARVVLDGIDFLAEVRLVMFVVNALVIAQPLAARGYRVQSPVDEHAETVVLEPAYALGAGLLAVEIHDLYLLTK